MGYLRQVVVALGGALMLANLYLVFMVAPTDAVLGDVQRVFYFHVPLAVLSFLAFSLVFIASLGYLATRSGMYFAPRNLFLWIFLWVFLPIVPILVKMGVRSPAAWDRLAHAAAEAGVVLVTLALLTGVIWARPIWGVWWTWEPRLTTTLILWLIYVAYLMVRAYAPNPGRGAVYAAVVGIVGFVDVPIVYYSVQWWRSIHPSPVVGPLAEAGALEPVMLVILLFSLLTFLVLFLHLLLWRIGLHRVEAWLREEAPSGNPSNSPTN